MTDATKTSRSASEDERAANLRQALVTGMRESTRSAFELRRALVTGLRERTRSAIPMPQAVEQALLTVPRHLYCPPGTSLEAAYADEIVSTRTDETTGRITSSISAPWLQARMLAQARIEPGMRVLEYGSSGYNAALLAELVGPDGQVVTVDIDPAVIDAARTALAATGYDDRVTAVCADAAEPLDLGTFDRIIVTYGVWDITPAWFDQLTPDGVLVVPLRARYPAESWSIAFHRTGDLLVGESSFVCGFVDVQGTGAVRARQAAVAGADGGSLTVRAWDDSTDLKDLPATVTDSGVRVDSGVVLAPPGMFVGLRTRLAYNLPGLAEATWEDPGLFGRPDDETWISLTHVDGDSLAVLCYRPVDGGHELGARGFGSRAAQAASTLAEQITRWGKDGMPQRAAHVYRMPGGTQPLQGDVLAMPGGGRLAVTLHHDGAEEI